MDFETLLKQWANEQGFQTWSQDHAAVLRNLVKWLNQHAAQHSVNTDESHKAPNPANFFLDQVDE